MHAECYTIEGGLECNLYGAPDRVSGACEVGGVVPTITLRPPGTPADGFVCVDEGYHDWDELAAGGKWSSGAYSCASRLVAKNGRGVGRLECFSGATGFAVDGDGARNLAATPTAPPTVRNCGRVGFTPNSDDGAFSIRAQGATCTTAKRVARATRTRGVGRKPYRFTTRGFRCRGLEDNDALPLVKWSCIKGKAIVTFDRA